MNNNVLMTLLCINFVLPVVIMIAFIKAHNKVIKTNNTRLFVRLGFVAVVIGVVLTFWGAYTAFSGFGPGTILCFGTFLMGLVTAFLLFDRRSLKEERGAGDKRASDYQVILKLVLVFTQLMPAFGTYIFYNACDSLHRQLAKPLILAIENYYTKNNEYPDGLEVLIPEYISELPTPICLLPYSWLGIVAGKSNPGFDTHYSIFACGNKKLLAVPATTLAVVRRYDFSNQEWSSADSLDGYCSDIE